MTCTSPSRARAPIATARAGRSRLRSAVLFPALALSWLLLGAPEAGSAPKLFRFDDPSFLGVVDSIQTSIVTVVGYPPPDASPRAGSKRKRLIGTAVAIGGDRILTSASLAIPGGHMRVLLGGGVERPVTLLGADRQSNIALFEVEGATLRPLRPAPPQSLAIGSWVAVISNVAITRPQAALGRIAGRGERIDFLHSGEILEIDAPSYPGSTGAAVLNEDGDWVAVIVGRAAPAPSGDGSRVGLGPGEDVTDPQAVLIALPVDQVAWIAKELDTFGSVRRGFLGIQLRRGNSTPPESLGILVASVIPGSPADSAGFRAGDRILAIEGEEAHTADELTDRVRSTRPGEEIEVTVLRRSEIFPIRAVVGAAFSEPPVGPRRAARRDVVRMKQELQRLEEERRRLEEEIKAVDGAPDR